MAKGYIDQILYNQETNALLLQAETYQKAQEERKRRATKLGRNNKQTQMRTIQMPTRFHMSEVSALHDNPMKQAEYLYSLIESESQ